MLADVCRETQAHLSATRPVLGLRKHRQQNAEQSATNTREAVNTKTHVQVPASNALATTDLNVYLSAKHNNLRLLTANHIFDRHFSFLPLSVCVPRGGPLTKEASARSK